MTHKPGLPICQHIELGGQLQTIRERLVDAVIQLTTAYPKSSPAVLQAQKALDAVDELRNRLDGISAAENPGGGAWSPTIYYGANHEKRAREIGPILQQHRQGDSSCCSEAGESER